MNFEDAGRIFLAVCIAAPLAAGLNPNAGHCNPKHCNSHQHDHIEVEYNPTGFLMSQNGPGMPSGLYTRR